MSILQNPHLGLVLDVLSYRASDKSGFADRPAFTYLDDGETVSRSVTYRELNEAAICLGGYLRRMTEPCDRVLLAYPPSLDYVIAFYACLYAGVVAVPTVSPSNARTAARLQSMLADCSPRLALTHASALAHVEGLGAGEGTLWIATDRLDGATLSPQAGRPRTYGDGPSDLAFLQYTSGSTGDPKGVMVTQANLGANVELIRSTYGIREGDTFVFWLPPHHDFGLIGAIVLPVWVGGHCVQFTPAAFLRRPVKWLKLIDRFKARITGAPNFAYQICVDQIVDEALAGIDLGSLEIAANGAERIRPGTLRRFAERFAPFGFRRDAFAPSYGMAETVLLAASASGSQADIVETRWLRREELSKGRAIATAPGSDAVEAVKTAELPADGRVAVVHPEALRRLGDGEIGEIWIRGASVAAGYWRREEQTEETFRAVLADDPEAGHWLRSGDLGFASDGGLYITGRAKETMIFNGRNVYPQDIEVTVEGLDPAFRPDGCAVFALEDGDATRMVVVQEVQARMKPVTAGLASRLRRVLAEEHELFDLSAVLLVRSGRLPRTSSGKIQRTRCRTLFEENEIESIWSWRHEPDERPCEGASPATATEEKVALLWREAFGRADIGPHSCFFDLGGNSLRATRIAAGIRSAFGVEASPTILFSHSTVSALAGTIDALVSNGDLASAEFAPVARQPVDEMPLSFNQERLWFLEQLDQPGSAYTIAAAFDLHGDLDVGRLASAVAEVAARHDVLRATFHGDEVPSQQVGPAAGLLISDLSATADPEAAARRAVQEDASRPFKLDEGPLLRTSLYVLGERAHVLCVAAHHIVFDGWSLALYLRELRCIYEGAKLPEPVFQYIDFAAQQRALIASGRLEAGLRHWVDVLAGAASPTVLPLDGARRLDAVRAGGTTSFELPGALEDRLVRQCVAARVSPFSILAAGLNAMLHGFEGQQDVSIGYPTAGRERAEWQGVIGFFANTLVLRTRMDAQETFASLLSRVQRSLLENAEHSDVPYEKVIGALKPPRNVPWTPLFQVFLSLFDADELIGHDGLNLPGIEDSILPITRNQAKFDLSFEFTRAGGRLRGLVEYDAGLFDAATANGLAELYVAVLEAALEQPQAALVDIVAQARARIGFADAARRQDDAVDRRGLPAPAASCSGDGYVAPRGAVEELVAQVWADLLGLTRVGGNDNFFDLGGHSLLATRVVSRLRRELHVEVPVRVLFEAPTLSAFAARLAAENAPPAPPIVSGPRDDAPQPASYAQERLFFLAQIDPDSTAYTIAAAVRLTGTLDAAALAGALDIVVARHDALRSTLFQDEHGAIMSRVGTGPTPLGRAVPVAGPDAMMAEARAFVDRPFRLGEGPLLRARLLQLSQDDHTLVLAMHHAVGDGWSLGVLVGEIEACYRGLAGGGEPALPALPVQYADYARWQRAWLSGEELERQTAYWRRQLSGAPMALDLPTDRVRPPAPSHRGAGLARPLGRELSERVDRLARRLGATPFMVMFSAFSTLLARFAGQEEVVVGTPIANRTRAETEPLAGLFINTLALRARIAGNPRFRDLVEQVRETTLQAYAHQDLPFEKVVEALGVPRDMSRSPVFQVMFQLQNAPMPSLRLPGLSADPVDLGRRTAKFDLTLELTPGEEGYLAGWEYATDLFDEQTVERIAEGFERLIRAAVDEPDVQISAVSLMSSETERHLLAGAGSVGSSEWDVPMHRRFEETARMRPDAVALICGECAVTYRELDDRATAIADALIAAGVATEGGVGICMARSVEMVAALLGTLKAGGYYIPMDPAYPAARLLDMLDAAGCRRIIVDEAGAQLQLPPGIQVIAIGDLTAPPLCATPVEVHPETCAYTIFTSGSTGRPKGVQVTHRALSNFLASMAAEPGLYPEDVLLAVTSISFDIAALELFLPLVRGACVVLVPREDAVDGRRLLELARMHRVTVMQATPATYRLMLAADWPASLQFKCLCGGEAMPAELARELLPRTTTLWNMYGPTETTIWSTLSRITGAAPRIGRPIAETIVRVLDGNGGLCPIGVAGELYIGGAGLARGYVNRPDLTAERFVPDPYATAPGSRLYRTGDLVAWRADGDIDYLGRIDHQVKIRGFRIELGEIEMRLAEHPDVRAAIVVAEAGVGRDSRLAAFVVPTEERSPSPAVLRAHLAARLPDYMIPARLVCVPELPLTPNGKVDRNALSRLATEGASGPSPIRTLPASPIELAVAELWRSVLGVEDVAREDNFFELGGHSLLAMHVVETLKIEMGFACTLHDLFETQGLSAFAARLEEGGRAVGERAVTLVELRGGSKPVFLVHALSGTTSPYRMLAAGLSEDVRVLAFQASPLDDEVPVETRIETLAARYAAEADAAAPDGPVRLVGWSMGGLVAFEIARRLEAVGRRVAPLILIDPPSPNLEAEAGAEEWYLAEWYVARYLLEIAREQGGEVEAALLRAGLDRHGDDEALISAARRLGLIPPVLTNALVQRRAALFERNHRAMLAYRPSGIFSGPIILLHPKGAPPAARWHDWASEGVTCEPVPGDHYTILRAAARSVQARL